MNKNKKEFLQEKLSPLVLEFFSAKNRKTDFNIEEIFNAYKKARGIYFQEQERRKNNKDYAMASWDSIMINNKPSFFESPKEWLSFVSKNKENLKEIIKEC